MTSTTSETTYAARAASVAAAARSDRNRAVDFYRALAMIAVALGHWAAVHVTVDDDGLAGGNALEYAPAMSWITWLFQVMPLFFVVGGFASAMSLDAHFRRSDARAGAWIATRLRRMMAPTATLATTWVALMVFGVATGTEAWVGAGLTAAAIPLWFLANYTIDTAIAPFLLPRMRRNPIGVGATAVIAFGALETLRFLDVPVLPQLNWVLGWLMFQMLGFAWRDGLLPNERLMGLIAATSWVAAWCVVTLGPWPAAMVHFPGLAHSPTHPPSLALMLFGLAYSSTAIALAPMVTRFLASNRGARAWTAVVAANSMAMTVYLWHMTAAVGAALITWRLGLLPHAAVGTMSWWIQKLPFMMVALVILVVLVVAVSGIERRALLAGASTWDHGSIATIILALAVSTGVKMWTAGSVGLGVAGCVATLVLWHTMLDPRRRGAAVAPRSRSEVVR